jgi:hypothetical protein
MKTLLPALLLLAIDSATAQDHRPAPARGLPITVTVFAESVSLPRLKSLFRGGAGLQLGTEFYYRNRPAAQLLQTVQAGYYHHPRLQNGLYLGSAFGYRKFLGKLYSEALVGAGVLALHPAYPTYRADGNGGYRPAAPFLLRVMPTASLGAGYCLSERAAVFARYEVFGELPFSRFVLPHQAIHAGTRLRLPR